jgi:pimeloyl-ACP methyl ester carboxylesterase
VSDDRRVLGAWGAALRVRELGPGGQEPVIVVLHGEEGPDATAGFASKFAEESRVVLPCHPGFGGEERVPGADRPGDLAYLYLELLDQLGVAECALVGCSLGAWIALEMAAMVPSRFSCLAAVSPVGVKFAGRTDRTFAEVLVADPDRVTELLYHDASRDPWHGRGDTQDRTRRAEHRETFAHYVWEPYLHNPKLRHLLGRLTLPVLMLTGASDRLVTPGYYKSFAAALPHAELQSIQEAGHYPEIEQPGPAADCVLGFLARHHRSLPDTAIPKQPGAYFAHVPATAVEGVTEV